MSEEKQQAVRAGLLSLGHRTNELHLSKLLAGRRRIRRLLAWGSGRGVGPLVTVVHRDKSTGKYPAGLPAGPPGVVAEKAREAR